jgi:hypothetical protein
MNKIYLPELKNIKISDFSLYPKGLKFYIQFC